MPEQLDSSRLHDRFQALKGDDKRDVSDRQLLEQFVARRDETAFAGLVERHGKTVWGVCRRMLHQEQDAEDAFQAVFLTLAHSAASIRQREAVGGWLYGVACRIAMKARRKSVRRKDYEQEAGGPAPEQPPWSEASCRELQRILDEEVLRLAEKYRLPFVLCCLEAMSKAEAARELGWKEGTVASRLAQARKLLQSRLARRGISLSAVLTAMALVQQTAAAAPAVLIQGALAPLTGQTAAAATLSPSVVALAKGAAPTLAAVKLKLGLLAASCAAIVTGLSVAAYQLSDSDEVAQPEAPAEALTFRPPPIPLLKPIDERIYVVAFSPDGTKLIAAGGMRTLPGQLKIWDIPGGKELVRVRGIPGVRTSAFSPNGKTIATAGMSGAIQLRDAGTGAEIVSVKGHTIGVNGVAFSPDGAALVSVGLDKLIKLWDVNGLKERATFRGHTDMIYSVAFFRDGERFVTGGRDATAKIWDTRTGKEKFTLRGHKNGVEMVAVSPDDKIVATASWDRTIKLWNAETGAETGMLLGESSVFAVAFSQSGKLLASASGDGTIRLWDVNKRELIKILGKHSSQVWSLSFSKGDRYLASGSSDTTAKLWDMKEMKELTTLKTTEFRPIQALAYSPDGKAVAMATDDNVIRLYDTRTGNVLVAPPSHAGVVTCVAYARVGKMLATGSADKTVQLWDGVTGKQHILKGHSGAVRAIAFTPDGKKLASAGDDKTIKIWDTESGAEVTTFKGHEAAIRALAFALDGRTLASGSSDQTIRLWDLEKQAEPVTLKVHDEAPAGRLEELGRGMKGWKPSVRALAFSAGHLASAGDDGTVKLWPVEKGKNFKLAQGTEPVTLRGHTGGVRALAFAPGGRTLVSGGEDQSIIVWDTVTGQAQQILDGHKGAVTGLALHPLTSDLVSGGLDTRLLRWPKADGLAALGHKGDKAPPKGGSDWPGWRGPGGRGIRTEATAVTHWSQNKGVRWKVQVPGQGHASPIIVGDQVFVFTAKDNAGTLSLLSYQRQTGALQWEREIYRGGFMVKHNKNSHASATPVCDGVHVYVPHIADDALWLSAVHKSGRLAWQRRLGPFVSEWGYASSPVLYKDLVIVVGDNRGSANADDSASTSYLAAVRSANGQPVWRVPRPLMPSYGSPVVARLAGRDQLLLSGAERIVAYDPATGKELWFFRWSALRSANSMACGPDCVYATATWPDQQVVCLRADGNGDVTDSHLVWKQQRNVSDVPSPLYHDGRLYLTNDRGIAVCMDGASGKTLWQNRLGGPIAASPVLAGQTILTTDEQGTTHLLKAGPQFELFATNYLTDRVLASPALSGNHIFLRGRNSLYCLDGQTLGPPAQDAPIAVRRSQRPLVDLYRDFRKQTEDDALVFMGAEASTSIRHEGGLRVLLPADRNDKGPVGVATKLRLRGDFEITASFEIIDVPRPAAGFGAGVSLFVQFDEPRYSAAAVAHYHTVRGMNVYSGDRHTIGDDGKSIHHGNNKPTAAKIGRLQLIRVGTELLFLAAEGLENPPVLFHKAAVGREDVHLLRLSGTTGNAPARADVRLLDLRIRGERIGDMAPAKAEAQGEAPVNLYQDFRGKEVDSRHFDLMGPDAAQRMKSDAAGLRITLPAEQKKPAAVGLMARFPIKGNFEITTAYEIVQAHRPTAGFGAGFEVYLKTNTPTREAIAFYRIVRPSGDDVYACSRMTTNTEGRRVGLGGLNLGDFPAAGNSGQLRITRIGAEAILSAAENPAGEFRELYRFDLGTEDVMQCWLAAHPGNAANPVDLRVHDFRVRVLDADRAEPPAPWSPVALLTLLAVLAGSGLIIGGLWVHRWRARVVTNLPTAQQETPHRFQCPGCGKNLKAKVELAGKKVKCPQCGTAVLVPGAEADKSAQRALRRRLWLVALVVLAGLVLCPIIFWLIYSTKEPAETPGVERLINAIRPDTGTGEIAEIPGVLYYDFKGKPLPPNMTAHGPWRDSYIKVEAEGLRINVPKNRNEIAPLRLAMPARITGDFEITTTLEILHVEEPPPAIYGLGVLLSINETTRIGRLTRSKGEQVVTWDHWASVQGKRIFRSGASPCPAKVVRLRFKRTATTLHFLWAAEAAGDDFNEIHQVDFGAEDITEIRVVLNANASGQPFALDFRLIDLEIRSGPGAFAEAKN